MTITIDAIFDGEVLRPNEPVELVVNQHYAVTISDAVEVHSPSADAWAYLGTLAGTYDGPADWSSQHDHYITGGPKTAAHGN